MEKKEKRKTYRRGRRKKRTIGGVISLLVFFIALGVFIYAAYNLGSIYWGRYKGDKEYNDLAKVALVENKDDKSEDSRYRVNFEELWKVNGDIKAWIRFDEPATINYPVVQGKDNAEYLDKTISGYDNTYGAIFINVDNKPDFTDLNTIIYGHRMNGGSMFGELNKYEDKAFWEKYPYFYIYTPDGGETRYQIFAVGVVNAYSDVYQTTFEDPVDYEEHLKYLKDNSTYDTGVQADRNSQIVTLSTCTPSNNDDRYMVCGVKVETIK